MICRAGQKFGRKIRSSNKWFCFLRSTLRFSVPQLSLGTGLLNQKRNPHQITSAIILITMLLFDWITRLFESRLSKQEKFDPHTRYLEVLTYIHPFSGSAVFTRNRLTESEVEPSFQYLSEQLGFISVSVCFSSFESPLRFIQKSFLKTQKWDPHLIDLNKNQFVCLRLPQPFDPEAGLLNQ